ncbi:YbjQ family protein [Flavobacterium sp.]|uniref:YbjQ family protein n=2 Tax=Flavobacterium sp. TaxID=239 RepID=UPI004047FE7E
MILTTTNSVEGFTILEYRGIVSGTAVNVQKMKLTFNMQKYYAGISESVADVKEQAFEQLRANAEKLNANAVVGIQVDIELTAANYVAISVTGTAVSIIKKIDCKK